MRSGGRHLCHSHQSCCCGRRLQQASPGCRCQASAFTWQNPDRRIHAAASHVPCPSNTLLHTSSHQDCGPPAVHKHLHKAVILPCLVAVACMAGV